MFYDMFARARMNAELTNFDNHPYPDKAERRAMKQARRAERAYRASRGYPANDLWGKVLQLLGQQPAF